jgi:hypothetical protein
MGLAVNDMRALKRGSDMCSLYSIGVLLTNTNYSHYYYNHNYTKYTSVSITERTRFSIYPSL